MPTTDEIRAYLNEAATAYADKVYPHAPAHVREGLAAAWLAGHATCSRSIRSLIAALKLDMDVTTETAN